MVKGFLSTFGFVHMIPAPAVQGLVYLRRLNLTSGWIHFMVDTGASGTCLHGPAALPLQDKMQQSRLATSRGVGGEAKYYRERAIVILVEEDGKPLPFGIDVLIQRIGSKDLKRPPNPSLLGRDILKAFDLTVNLKTGRVLLKKLR